MSKAVLPSAAWLTVNRECNLRCPWCYAKTTNYENSQQMSLPLAENLSLIAKEAGIKNLLIIGGEPTLWKNLFRLNTFVKKIGLKTVLVTNVLMFANDKFWVKYKENPCDTIGASIKAGNRQEFRRLTRIDAFKLIQKGLKRISSNFKNYGVSFTYNQLCRRSLLEQASFVMDCGAHSFKIDFCSPVFARGVPDKVFMVEPREIVKDIVESYPALDQKTKGKLVFEMNLPFCLWPREFIEEIKAKKQIVSVCHVMKRSGVVFNTDGSILLCNALMEFPVAYHNKDFKDGASLIELINSRRIRQYYDGITAYPSHRCIECEWYLECGGGCPLRWAVYKPGEIIQP